MKVKKNEKGLTLIEVLASIVILSIILLTLMRFFPQMGLMNTQNQGKTQAINMARQVLVEWENTSSTAMSLFFTSPSTSPFPQYQLQDSNGDYFIFKKASTIGNFTIYIKIKKSSDFDLYHTPVYNTNLIIVQVFNQKNTLVTETYGYLVS